jgi:ribosome biogenesis protein UTP30
LLSPLPHHPRPARHSATVTTTPLRRQPIPIAIQRKDLKAELERAISATYLQISTGTSLSVKIGSTSLHSAEQLTANLLALIPQLAVRIPHSNWDNIQSLHIKSATSTSLPIYSVSLDKEGRFKGPSAEEEAAKTERAALKEAKEEERIERELAKEQRRIERSATKDGKGRDGKKSEKRKAQVEEVEEDVSLTEPIAEATKPAKAKKAAKAEVAEVEASPRPAKKSKKVKA